MKKNKWKMPAASVLLFLSLILPVGRVYAEGNSEFLLDESGTVTMISQEAAEKEVSSIQFSLLVESPDADRVEFEFAGDKAKITEFRFHKEENKLNVYIAGTEPLFSQDSDSVNLGRVIILDVNGGAAAATVSVAADSVQYVYGTNLQTPEGLTTSAPVAVNGQPSDSGGDDSGDDWDDDSDDDSDDDNSQNADDNGQGTGVGTQTGNGEQGTGTQGTTRPTAAPPAVMTTPPVVTAAPPAVTTTPPAVTTEPPVVTTAPPAAATEPPAVTAVPSPDAGREPSASPDSLPAGSQDMEESSEGINWILILVIVAVILFVGAAVMAVVVLNKKPNKPGGDDGDYLQ